MCDSCWEKKPLHSAVHPSDGNLDIILTASVQKSPRNCNEGAPSFRTSSRRHRLGNRVLVRGRRSQDTAWIHTHLSSVRNYKHTQANTPSHTGTNKTQRYSAMSYAHTFPFTLLDLPLSIRNIHLHTRTHTHTLIQAPHLPQFAEQTVRRSTPLWGSFSRARDMKSQLNSYAAAC